MYLQYRHWIMYSMSASFLSGAGKYVIRGTSFGDMRNYTIPYMFTTLKRSNSSDPFSWLCLQSFCVWWLSCILANEYSLFRSICWMILKSKFSKAEQSQHGAVIGQQYNFRQVNHLTWDFAVQRFSESYSTNDALW